MCIFEFLCTIKLARLIFVFIGVRKEEESKFDQLQVISATNPLSIVIPTESLETDKLTQNQIKDSESLTPGQIKEAQLCDFACQISSGLAYLASMNVSDLDQEFTLSIIIISIVNCIISVNSQLVLSNVRLSTVIWLQGISLLPRKVSLRSVILEWQEKSLD